MAEEFGVDSALGYGATVDCHVGTMLACAEGVYDLWEDLLASAALADYENGELDRRDLYGHVDGSEKLGVVADDSEACLDVGSVHGQIIVRRGKKQFAGQTETKNSYF